MKLNLLALAAVLCGLCATGLELHPSGALTPEETAAVAEARSLHEAALLQASFDDDNDLLLADELFDDEEDERQLGWAGRVCHCFLVPIYTRAVGCATAFSTALALVLLLPPIMTLKSKDKKN